MSQQTGSDSVIGLKIGATFGTANSASTGDKWEVESLAQTTNPEELTANPIGSGAFMTSDSQQGGISPTVNVEAIDHYNNAGVAATALFYGGESVMTMGGGYYSHSFLHNETLFNNKIATICAQYAGGSVMEFVSAVPTRVQKSWESAPQYGRIAIDFLADQRKVTATTNTFGSLEAITVADATKVVIRPNDSFTINTFGEAALSASYKVDCISIASEALKPHTHVNEIRGAAGNGRAIATGSPPYEETVTVVLKSLDDHTWLSGAAAGSEYKARLTITHSSGSYSKIYSWPRLKLVQDPQYGLTSSGINGVTLVFKALFVDASLSLPAGMIDRYPYEIVTNTKATAYLA